MLWLVECVFDPVMGNLLEIDLFSPGGHFRDPDLWSDCVKELKDNSEGIITIE